MKRFIYYQPNKKDKEDYYGDCVMRALCKATKRSWLKVFDELVTYARELQCMPHCQDVYEKYLIKRGFKWVEIKKVKNIKRPTVKTFYKIIPKGTCILTVRNHLVTVVDGYYYDTWDSGDKSVFGYYIKGADYLDKS